MSRMLLKASELRDAEIARRFVPRVAAPIKSATTVERAAGA